MKKLLFIQLLLLIALISKGQETVLSVAPTLNTLCYYQFVVGGPSVDTRLGLNIALEHIRSTKNKVSYGYGLGYKLGRIELGPSLGIDGESHIETISLISANFKTVFNFRKSNFFSVDPLVDIQLNKSTKYSISNQSGIGISVGYGRRILFNEKISITIEPRLWVHNVVPFVDTHIPQRLTVIGLKAGIKLGQDR